MQAERPPSPANALTAAAGALRAGARLYEVMGTPLYANLCARGAEDADIAELVSRARAGAAPMHLFSSVHYLLLRNPNDALSRYFATLTSDAAPPQEAFPQFTRYCREHREAILELLHTRTVQTTYVQRCATLMPLLSRVADEAGEPLNLIEVGCSAGVLLTFDQYAYQLAGRGRVGPAGAPLTLPLNVIGGPPLRIPQIGTRIGLDLDVVDVHSEDERRWLLALSFPEHREQQQALAVALNVVGKTSIQMIEGDALQSLPTALAATPDPLCVFHSACLMYWPQEAKAALERMLSDASVDRDIYRVSIEPSDRFESEHRGQTENLESGPSKPIQGEAIITRYRRGSATRMASARTVSDYASFTWVE